LPVNQIVLVVSRPDESRPIQRRFLDSRNEPLTASLRNSKLRAVFE
jgi:hypothetical protein